MKSKTLVLLFSITILFVNNSFVKTQITEDDVASWGLDILSSQLSKRGYDDYGSAAAGLARLFEKSSNRKYNTSLATIMNSLNLPNGIYAINNGNISTVPDGYIKQQDQWFSFHDFENGQVTIIANGNLWEANKNTMLFHDGKKWMSVDLSRIAKNQLLYFENSELKFLNDGWYSENGQLKSVSGLNQQLNNYTSNETMYKFNYKAPLGIYFTNDSGKDKDKDGLSNTEEYSGVNKKIYNLAKEDIWVYVNIPNFSNCIVLSAWRGKRMIGTTVKELKRRTQFVIVTGNDSDPSRSMDVIDRVHLDVKKHGPGTYKFVASSTDKEFAYYEKNVKIIYEP